VDDEHHWVDFARTAFAGRGIRLVDVPTLEAAAAHLTSEGALALLINAHLIQNWQDAEALAARGQVRKVIALASIHSTSLAVQAFRHGCDYVDKPFSQGGVDELSSLLLAAPNSPRPQVEPVKGLATAHALIVEDRPEWRRIFRRALADIPALTLTVTKNFREATEALEQDTFHLIITDLRLIDEDSHNIDGLVLLKRLYDSEANVAIILTSGFASLDLIREAMLKYHALDFFQKGPDSGQFELERFRNCVRDVVGSIVDNRLPTPRGRS